MNGEGTMSQTSVNVDARSVSDSNGALSEDKGVARSELPSSSIILGERSSYEGFLSYSFGALEPAETGAFRWSTESLPAMTSRGEELSYVVSEDGLTLTAETPEGRTAFRVVVEDVLSGRYEVETYRGLDHENPLLQDGFSFNVGQSLAFDIDYVLTDSEGNTASSALHLQVNDSRPTVRDYGDNFFIADEGASSVSLNLLEAARGSDGVKLYRVKLEGGDAVGQISFTTDGEITFTPNSDFGGLATIQYDVVDGDGDMVSGERSIYLPNDATKPVTPDSDGDDSTRNPTVVMRESHIDDVKGVLVKKGFLGYDFGFDGPGRFYWHIGDLPDLKTESGSSVNWSITRNGRSLEGLDDNGERVMLIQLPDLEGGVFKVALFQPLDHGSVGAEYLTGPGHMDLDIGYTIIDSYAVGRLATDRAQGVLHIDLLDDPTVKSARAYRTGDDVTAEPSDVSALVAPVARALVSPDTSVLASPVATPVSTRFSGSASSNVEVETGRLIEGSSGFEGSSSFDASSTIGAMTHSTSDSNEVLSEYAVVERSVLPSSSISLSERSDYVGYLHYSFGSLEPAEVGAFRWSTESLPVLTLRGELLTYVVSEDGLTLTAETADGRTVFRLVVDDVLAGSYQASVFRALDHANPISQGGFSFNVGESLVFDIGYVLTDSQGNTASSALRLQVDDSRPDTRSDHVDADAGATSVSWNVLDNDLERADGLELYRAKVEGGDAVGQVSFTTEGLVTFTPNSDFSGLATIQYDVVDGDGDIASDVFTVYIIGGADKPSTPDSDGDDTTYGPIVWLHEPDIDEVEGVLVEEEVLGYDFGLDGPGSFAWHWRDLPDLATEDGSKVNWSIDGNGHLVAGRDDAGDLVMSIELTDLESGAYKVSLFQPLDHDSVGSDYSSWYGQIYMIVGYTITDATSDSASGLMEIEIMNDYDYLGDLGYVEYSDRSIDMPVDVSASSAAHVEIDLLVDSRTSAESQHDDSVITLDMDAERVAEVGEGTLTSSGSVEVALSISDLLDDSDEGDVLLTMEASQDSHLESHVAGHVTGSSGQGADSTSSSDAQASSSVQAPGLALASGFQWGSDNPLGQWLGESTLIHE